jgi:phenylalanyl-tRNA synthetase alpha subunit
MLNGLFVGMLLPCRPAKYFSVDRVFRNEAVDRTHLAEFHQVEGVICDRGLTLGHLIATLREFFSRLGMKELRFKPAFNPYTEPSMEIFGYAAVCGCSFLYGICMGWERLLCGCGVVRLGACFQRRLHGHDAYCLVSNV